MGSGRGSGSLLDPILEGFGKVLGTFWLLLGAFGASLGRSSTSLGHLLGLLDAS